MNRTFGAAMIIAGTTIGAGMLALPIVSNALGPIGMILALIFMWALIYYAGLVHVEINLVNGGEPVSVSVLAGRWIGPKTEAFMSFILVGLFFALLAAYLTGMASVASVMLRQVLGIDLSVRGVILGCAAVFTTATILRMTWLDYVNRLFVVVKILAFSILIMNLLPFINLEKAFAQPVSFNFMVLPILFTSFGFHGSIPSVMRYLQNDPVKIRKAFFWGTFLPLIVYLLWCGTTVSIIPRSGPMSFNTIAASGQDVGVLMQALNHWTLIPSLSYVANIFAFLAIVTSFFGVGIGLVDFFHLYHRTRWPQISGKTQTMLTASSSYLIPLGFALFYPQGFIAALGYAAIALALLAITIPCIIALKQRFYKKQGLYRVKGGNLPLIIMLCFSLSIIIIEIAK
jgi:tyrosine-specific transport protein